ncbi:MAG: aminotransferase class V-fold PLP-dependent enzyme, partial [Candidatus Dormibacteraeota bacterium]|nr:aminotransferase class V-fold PLP-dependent enzyme [Candidatus Dormibacteraeota bacterium]
MTTLPATIDRAACERLDAGDPLRAFRDRFLCDDDLVYLDGNSLGRIPRETPRRLATLLGDEWGRGLVRSWTSAGWMESPLRCGDAIAEIIGAGPGEVLVTDSTSVDLFKLAAAVMDARPRRRVLLTEHENFPTDRYIAGGVTELLGAGRMLRSVPRQEISAAIDDDTALLLLTHVDFRTGERLDMRALTDAAHAKGALVLWDLSHSTGAINVDLHAAGADLATGCGYKYLNGGPGAPAYLFVNTPLQSELRNPIRGWLGHESPFTY